MCLRVDTLEAGSVSWESTGLTVGVLLPGSCSVTHKVCFLGHVISNIHSSDT